MIQVQTWLIPSDNSGASFVECIKTLGGYNRKVSYPGDFLLISVKALRLIRKVRVGQVHLALFVRSKKEVHFLDGSYSSAEKNAVILMNKKQRILGTRFFGWVSRNLRRKKFFRILILCGRNVL
jgi:large subunit ribosomal protein L14